VRIAFQRIAERPHHLQQTRCRADNSNGPEN